MFLDSKVEILNADMTFQSATVEEEQLMNESYFEDEGVPLSFLTEEEVFELVQEGILSERTIVRLDKAAKLNRTQRREAIRIAKRKHDPLYKKYAFIWQLKKKIGNLLWKKYQSPAKSNARKIMSNMGKNPKVQQILKNHRPAHETMKYHSMPGK